MVEISTTNVGGKIVKIEERLSRIQREDMRRIDAKDREIMRVHREQEMSENDDFYSLWNNKGGGWDLV